MRTVFNMPHVAGECDFFFLTVIGERKKVISKEEANEHIRDSVEKLIDSGQFDSPQGAAAWYAAGCPDFLMDDAVSENHPKADQVLYTIYVLVYMN